ncbi:hypothetical protein [Aeromonas salmonicida]|uniref:hypothetical protein n=1 Tax=Aeromonas salmonicida TaxID=645 RepID=UPI001BABCF5D|nr:hypothetical protein [Aeromonas salmonicida]MBS2782515.1 hypothetical protein [Aeromonas salmonicida]
METFKDLLSSIFKSTEVRFTNVAAGSFIISWCLCNWDKLALLILGKESLTYRISRFHSQVNIGNIETIVLPLTISLVYLFVLPRLNLFIQNAQAETDKNRHESAIKIEIERERQLGLLLKEKYKSGQQDKVGQQEIDSSLEIIKAEAFIKANEALLVKDVMERERIQLEREQLEIKKSNDENTLRENELKKSQLTIERELYQRDKEINALEVAVATRKNRERELSFPAAYNILLELSKVLTEDEIHIPLDIQSSSISILFGFNSFQELLESDFNVDMLTDLSYVLIEHESLEKKFDDMLSHFKKDISSIELIEHLSNIFIELFNLKLLGLDSISEETRVNFENEPWDIISDGGVSSAIAETNAYFDYVDDIAIESSEIKENEVAIEISCTISGESDQDKLFYGDTIDASITVTYPIILGKSGLGEVEYSVSAEVRHPDPEPDDI